MSALSACAAESGELSCAKLRAFIVIGIFTSRRCVRRWCVVVAVTNHLQCVAYTRVPLRPGGIGRRPSIATTSP